VEEAVVRGSKEEEDVRQGEDADRRRRRPSCSAELSGRVFGLAGRSWCLDQHGNAP
jgi:hypothetical protein